MVRVKSLCRIFVQFALNLLNYITQVSIPVLLCDVFISESPLRHRHDGTTIALPSIDLLTMEDSRILDVIVEFLCDRLTLRVLGCASHGFGRFSHIFKQGSLVKRQDHSLLVVEKDLAHCLHTLGIARLIDDIEILVNSLLTLRKESLDLGVLRRKPLSGDQQLVESTDDAGAIRCVSISLVDLFFSWYRHT